MSYQKRGSASCTFLPFLNCRKLSVYPYFTKNSYGISMGFGFWPWNFQGLSHQNHQGETLFSLEFCKVTNLKFQQGFQKSTSSTPLSLPPSGFFWNSQILACTMNLNFIYEIKTSSCLVYDENRFQKHVYNSIAW